MGSYHEPRVPQGSPVDNEKDVWLDHGEIKFGHWYGSAWVVDRIIGAIDDSDIIDFGTDILAGEPWKYFVAYPYTHPENWPTEGEGHLESPWVNKLLNKLRYRKLTNGLIELGGEAQCDGTNVSGVAELPAGYGPANSGNTEISHTSQVWNAVSSTWVDTEIHLESDGFTGGIISPMCSTKVRFLGFTFTP